MEANIRRVTEQPVPERLQLPAGAAQGPISGANTNLGLGIGASYFNDYRNPVIQQWNANIQQELPHGFLIEVGLSRQQG